LRWLALAGYMGAGKSVVGRRTAARLGWTFIDADRAIEEAAGMPIPEIFSKRGELWFRRTEEDVIREIVQRTDPGVIALGGGALGSTRTADLLRRRAWVVWLRVSPDVAWRRVEGSDRPLAQDRERFERRAAEREPTYQAAADLEVLADDSPDDIAARVAAWTLVRGQSEREQA
jgi:shikimate kinase